MNDRIFTSKETKDIIRKLANLFDYKYRVFARISFALSIKINGISNDITNFDSDGQEFHRSTLFETYELFYKSLLETIYNKKLSEEEFLNKFKYHMDDGSIILNNMFEEVNYNKEDLLIKLTEYIKTADNNGESNLNKEEVKKLDIKIGHDEDNMDIFLKLNNKEEHGNSHLAIMGKPGQGKTQILLNILAKIREKSNYQTNFIFFDYKHDGGIHNSNFLDITKADVYELPHNKLPINPFILNSYDEKTIKMSANEQAESFSSIDRKFGPVQKGNLQDAIQECYKKRENMEEPFPDFNEIYNKILEIYEDNGIKKDTLVETLRNLSEFDLFWDHKTGGELINNLSEKTFIVDLSKLTILKELVVYITIERLYKEMTRLPDAKIEGGYRQIKTILVIDEAHNYLSQKNIFLEKIIREGRSKGIVVFFASQSPKDYEQDHFNFKELLEFSLILNSDDLSTNSIQKLIGCSSNSAKELQDKIPNLSPGELITKSKNQKGYIKIKGNMFWQEYE